MSVPVVVIGAGANELVCAHYLARAGFRALVLDERAAAPNGVEAGSVPEIIVRDLDLERHGLAVEQPDPWIATPLPAGGRLELSRDMGRSVEAIRKVSPRDAAKWPEFCTGMENLARLLAGVYLQAPPDPLSRDLGDMARLARLGLKVRGLGRRGMEDLMRLVPMSAADFLDDTFESDALKGVLGAACVMNLGQGPRSGGTALRLLHHHVGNPSGVFRPPWSNASRVLKELPGIELRAGAEIRAIAVREGRVTGVLLARGEEIAATVVVSGADPRRTLLELMDPGWLDPELVRALRHVRCRGVVARVTLSVARSPGFSVLAVAPSLDYLERASDEAKYHRVSQAPLIEARSAGTAADGRHRVEVHFQYAPYALAAGWDEGQRRALGELALATLSRHAPELPPAAVESVLTPRDLEERYGYPEGQAEHAEPALDQLLWMRPVPELARYRTPIAGLYLCGAATHPGGTGGACGYNAAREILRDQKP